MTTKEVQATHWDRCLERVGTRQDKAAFAEIFRHFFPMLKAYMLMGSMITPEVAEELVQATMIRLWQKAPEFLVSQSSADSWIFGIARDFRISWHYQQTSRVSEVVNVERLYSPVSSQQGPLMGKRNRPSMVSQLKLLPEEQMVVLHKILIEGKSTQVVADELGLSQTTVRSRIKLALQNIGKEATPSETDNPDQPSAGQDI